MKNSDYSIKTGCFIFLLAFVSIDLHAQNTMDRPFPQFLFPEFTEATIIMKDGKNFTTQLNYNMVDEIMVSELKGVYRSANNPQLFDTIILQNRIFVPIEKNFYELLAGGPVSFFLEHNASYTPLGSSIGYGVKSHSIGPTVYKRFEYSIYNEPVSTELPPNVEVTLLPVYWVRIGTTMEKFNNEKQFLKIFPEKETQLKKFIKREKIMFKVREDMIKLARYCNSL